MITVKNLSKIYKTDSVETLAVDNISFKIDKGEFVAIMGPSGSGKSTLMHILGALDIPTSGTYILDGADIGRLNDDELAEIRNKKIGFVFQQFNLLNRVNILNNVEVPLIYAGVNSKKRKNLAKQVLENVGLSNRLKHRPNEISGGEKQRAAIARALVNNPLIILADEPTGNLDSKNGEEIMKIFNKLHQEGHTIIIVTHELEVAKYAQRIIHLHDGLIENDEVIENVF